MGGCGNTLPQCDSHGTRQPASARSRSAFLFFPPPLFPFHVFPNPATRFEETAHAALLLPLAPPPSRRPAVAPRTPRPRPAAVALAGRPPRLPHAAGRQP